VLFAEVDKLHSQADKTSDASCDIERIHPWPRVTRSALTTHSMPSKRRREKMAKTERRIQELMSFGATGILRLKSRRLCVV
jgi:hypothetical protein